MPGIIAATIFAFTVSWGQFLYPMAYLYTSDQMVLTVGIITELIRGDVFQWGKIMAGCVLAAAPPVIVYAFLMDYYIAGLTAGATRGLADCGASSRRRATALPPCSEREHGCGGTCSAVKRTPRSAMERPLWRALRSFPGRPV